MVEHMLGSILGAIPSYTSSERFSRSYTCPNLVLGKKIKWKNKWPEILLLPELMALTKSD